MISTRNLELANKDPLCQGPIIRVRCWQVEVSLKGEVAIGENHRRDQSPHVEGETHPGRDDLHPDGGHVGRNCF